MEDINTAQSWTDQTTETVLREMYKDCLRHYLEFGCASTQQMAVLATDLRNEPSLHTGTPA